MEKQKSILIIDDDEGMLRTLNYILTDKGYEVVTLSSGFEAIALIKERSFNVILIDIKMPGMNGVEVFKEIKSFSPATNIMMITAYTMHKLVGEAKREGVQIVLPKPLDLDEVISYIDGFKSDKLLERDNDLGSSELLYILEERENELREKSLLISELKKELIEIKANPAAMLEQERREKQSENIHTLLTPKQLELFKILRQGEKNYDEIFKEACSKNINIRDMHALRLLISRLNKKLRQETNFKIERTLKDKIFYFKISSG
ncbi:MAG: response regulator [Deltaproteobacteria bacterium]|nr:response regulator [Deltaproteobacteria bacterium]